MFDGTCLAIIAQQNTMLIEKFYKFNVRLGALEVARLRVNCASLLFIPFLFLLLHFTGHWTEYKCNVHHWQAFHICLLRIAVYVLHISHFAFINDNFLKLQGIFHSITINFIIGMQKFQTGDNLTYRVTFTALHSSFSP